MGSIAIRIDGLTKDFSLGWRGFRLRAVDDLDLTVRENQVFGLLGPNGSGKSTTIKILLGLLRPTVGETSIFGQSSSIVDSRQNVGYLPEAPDFYRFLTARELIRFFGKLSGLRGRFLRERTAEVLEAVGLTDAADRRINTYSKGMLQRTGLAQALVHNPRLVILDEPTAGVDPLGAEAIAKVIQSLKDQGKTVLLCSHLLTQVERLCDAVAIVHKGRCVLQGDLETLLEKPNRAHLTIADWAPEHAEGLADWLARHGMKMREIRPERDSLEALFLKTAHESEERTRARAGTDGTPNP